MSKPIFAPAGSTFFTRSNTLLGKLIRYGETDKDEAKGSTWANHAGVVVESGWIGDPLKTPQPLSTGWIGDTDDPTGLRRLDPQAIVIEALWKTRKGPLKLNGTQVRVFRPIPPYTPEELTVFRFAAEQYVGSKYGWWKLAVQFADRLVFRGKKVFTTALFIDKRPICSYLAAKVNASAEYIERVFSRRQILTGKRATGPQIVAESAAAAGYAFGIPPQAADPDEMMDFCLAHPDLWEEVR